MFILISLLAVFVVVAIVCLIIFLRWFTARINDDDQHYIDRRADEAIAEVAARRFNATIDEVLHAIRSPELNSSLCQQLQREIVQCEVSFSGSAQSSVVMTILVSWNDGNETKIEQGQEWDRLPEPMRTQLIRTGQPYNYIWLLPEVTKEL